MYYPEPNECEPDGVFTCADCGELIPGGYDYWEFDGKYYCDACAREHAHGSAPYREEWY